MWHTETQPEEIAHFLEERDDLWIEVDAEHVREAIIRIAIHVTVGEQPVGVRGCSSTTLHIKEPS